MKSSKIIVEVQKQVLEDAYLCAILVAELTGSVISSNEGSENDVKYNKAAKRFMRFYKNHKPSKPRTLKCATQRTLNR